MGDGTVATGAAALLRRLVGGEVLRVAGAIVAAAVLSSLAPPSKALAAISSSTKRVGPGPITTTLEKGGYRIDVRVAPNKAVVPNDFSLHITRGGQPVRDADVLARFTMLD